MCRQMENANTTASAAGRESQTQISKLHGNETTTIYGSTVQRQTEDIVAAYPSYKLPGRRPGSVCCDSGGTGVSLNLKTAISTI